MSNLKEKRDLLPVTVMEGVTVNVVPDEKFEFCCRLVMWRQGMACLCTLLEW